MLEHWCQGINKCWNIDPKGCKLASQICCPFFSLGANTRPQCSAFISNLGQIEKLFSMSALTPTVKPLGLISTFAPIGMLDLSWTSSPTPSVKWALEPATDNRPLQLSGRLLEFVIMILKKNSKTQVWSSSFWKIQITSQKIVISLLTHSCVGNFSLFVLNQWFQFLE